MRGWVLVLLLALGSCSPEPASLEDLFEAGSRELQLGHLRAASQKAEDGRRRAAEVSDAEWERSFRVLSAEILVEQRRSAEALPLLEDAVRPGDGDALSVRALLTRGFARCLSAPGTEARHAAELDLVEAGRLAARLSTPDLAAWVQLRRGSCALAGGDVATAESHFRTALDAARRDGLRALEANAAGSLGFARATSSRYDDATDWLEKALAISASLEADLLRVKVLGNLGWCYYELGDYDRALTFLEQVESLALARGQTGNLQIALQAIGNIHYRLGHSEQASHFYRRALDLARDHGNPRATAQLLSNLGIVAIDDGRHDDAEPYVREALRIKDEIGDPSGRQHSVLAEGWIEEGRGQWAVAEARYRQVIRSPHSDVALLWEARASLASFLVNAERPREAEAEFQRAFEIMERSRSQLRRAAHKISFFSSLSRFYDSYVDFLVDDGRSEGALEVADQSRARLLREGPEGERPPTPARVARFRQAAHALDAVLMAYWLAPDRSLLWVVTPSQVVLHVLPGEREIRPRVERHQARVLRSRDPLAEGASDSIWLYRTLIAPAESAIPPGSQVVIIPDGALHQLNPETLVVPSPEPHYWIEDATLATAPSLSLLSEARGARLPRPDRGLLVIGDPVSPSEEFPRLEHAGSEIQRITEPFEPPEVTVYSRARAEPAVYRRADPSRFSLIHFAAHAKANREIPLDSAVILSAREDAYKLYAREIVDVPLQADLVTLSACRSAGSRTYAGEGLVGLAWAFLSSGARNVIAGLWNVEDASTAELMGELYRGLQEGQPPAQALRAAKLSLLRSETAYRKPYYWAPFVVYTQRGAAALRAVDSTVSEPQ